MSNERIVANIGRIGPASEFASEFKGRSYNEDREWLQDVFGISSVRASSLIQDMNQAGGVDRRTQLIPVVLNYEQLGRYVCKRQVEGINRYWKYPHVLSFEPDPEPA